LLTITEGKWFAGDDTVIDGIKWTAGVHHFTRKGYPSLLVINKVNEPEPLPLNEVQAEAISGYQDWLTEEWVKQLKKKYTVKIDNQVFSEVKKRLGNE
jgi:peptidyl-prolyl cis-trans isomerase SurA